MENVSVLKITRKAHPRGEDGYETFSVRVKTETVQALKDLSGKTNRSRNELINLILAFGVSHVDITN